MMKSKSTIISLSVFIIILCIFITINNLFDKDYKYSCIDESTNTTYRFNSKEEMEKVCSKFNQELYLIDESNLDEYPIYNKLINVDDSNGFSFDPYINSDNHLAIIVKIIDCDNQEVAIRKSKEWFVKNNFNINNYEIEYEYPCS